MGLLDFILNLVGLLLWFNWRAARFDPLSVSRPATLAGTIRRAEKTAFKRWHLPFALLGLLILRVPLYMEFGSALNWTGKIDVGTISLPFKSNVTSFVPMLLYSFYSFGVMLAVFLIWVLLLSAVKSEAAETDSLRQLLQLHLGKVERWSRVTKLLLPLLALTPIWWMASWPLTFYGIMPAPSGMLARLLQALLVGVGSYLAWKFLLIGIFALYFVSSYVFFGRQPFWQHLDLIARQLLAPLRRLPLRLGKLDLAPLVGIILVFGIAFITEHGIKTPQRYTPEGKPSGRLVDLPGLVDFYERISK
ncbi:MAG: YggT family protein [Verrucomicrobiota bacterium]